MCIRTLNNERHSSYIPNEYFITGGTKDARFS